MRAFVAVFLASAAAAAAPLPAIELRTNYMAVAPAIDDPNPRFSWVLQHPDRAQAQSAYHVTVSIVGGAMVWDSGVVSSNASIGVVYRGSPLVSNTYYTWSVQWADLSGAMAPAASAAFATALFTQAEWAPSQWIGCHQPLPGDGGDNQLRTEFTLALAPGVRVTQARAYITGLGYYRAFVNGQRLGRVLHLDPAWTIPSTRVLYSAFEVGPLLNPSGPNAIAAYLGNGWEDVLPNGFNGTGNAGLLRILADELVARGAVTRAQADAAADRLDFSSAVFPSTVPAPGAPPAFDTSNWGPVSAVLTALRTEGGAHTLMRSAIARGAVSPSWAAEQLSWDGDGGIADAIRKFRMQLVISTSDGQTLVVSSTANGMGSGGAAVPAAAAPTAPLFTPIAASWTCGSGALVNDSIYDGVVWDASKETVGWDLPGYSPPAPWAAAVNVADPGGRDGPTLLTAQNLPLMEVVEELAPRSLNSPAPGVYVFDFGQNFQGVCRVALPAPIAAGIKISLRHAELLTHPPYGPVDGSIYVGNLRGAKATDNYTTREVAEGVLYLEPIFTTHGFRYVEVTGLPFVPTLSLLTGLYIRSAAPQTGSVAFPSGSAEPMNQLSRAATWGLGSNLLGVVSDCPQRDERKGWMGDSSLTAEAVTLAYDMCAFFENWANLMLDSQLTKRDAHPAGSLADTTPRTFGTYPADPAWGTAYPAVVEALLNSCGDIYAVQRHFQGMADWVAWMQSQVDATGLGDLYSHYGEWVPPPVTPGGGQGPKPPSPMVSSYAYLADVSRMIRFATVLGDAASVSKYTAMFSKLTAQYNAAWFHNETAIYGNTNGDGLQSSHAASLALGVVPDNRRAAVVANFVKDINVTHGGHWFAGITGTKFFHRQLTQGGAGDLAVATLVDTTYPSFGYMWNNPNEPATTVWELPDSDYEGTGMNSRNHHMFATPLAFLFDVAGVRQAPSSFGWAEGWVWPSVTSSPFVPYAAASYNSIRGSWSSEWARLPAGGFSLNTTVPVGATATVVLPLPQGAGASGVAVSESGLPVISAGAFVPGVVGVSGGSITNMGASTGPAAVLSVGSGTYTFVLSYKAPAGEAVAHAAAAAL